MGIRGKKRKEERRQQIMAAAKREFTEKGFYRAKILLISPEKQR